MSFIQSGRSRLFYINSRNRVSGTDSDFTYKIEYPEDQKFDSVVCLSAIIPTSFYLVDSLGTFTLQEDAKTTPIDIPSGNYTRTTFKNTVQDLLNAKSPNGYVYTVSVPSTSTAETGFYSFAVAGNGGVQPAFILAAGSSNNIFEPMGFDYGTHNFTSDGLISQNVTKLIAEDSIYIHSDICTNGDDSILQEVYSQNVPYFSTTAFHNPSPEAYSKQLTSNTSNIYRFYLTNEDDEALNLNGLNWNATILLYKRNNIDIVQKKFMDFLTTKLEKLK